MVGANHGGGYHYSLCPKSDLSEVSEACFEKTSLVFADSKHTIRYLNNGTELTIPAIDVSVGTYPTGSTWRVNPIPACACDWGRGCAATSKNSLQKAYSKCSACDYPECGKEVPLQFPLPFQYGYGQQIWNRKRYSASFICCVAFLKGRVFLGSSRFQPSPMNRVLHLLNFMFTFI
jgi:hypothetical protein